MRDWCTKELGDFAEIKIGGTPSRAVSDYWADSNDDGLPWVSIADLKGRFLDRTKERITARGVIASNVKRIPANTLLMSFKLSVGRAAISTTELYTNEAIAAIVPAADVVGTDYLYYLLPPIARSAITDTAVKGATLNKASLSKLELAFPKDKKKQKKIARILQTVDKAIEKTEALIEKYSQIKAGMMQDLFTRGLSPDGKLRPPRTEAPELYQETPIGWIPKEWTVGGLRSVTDDYRQPILTGPFGADLGNADFVAEGIPLLRIGNVQSGYLFLGDLLFVTEEKAAQLSKYRVKNGDLLFARQGATTGRNCLADASVEGYLINYHIIRVALDHAKCAPIFVEAAFNERAIKSQIERDKGRGTREGINTQQLVQLSVPFPPLPEQRAIAALIRNLNSVVQQERRSLAKLRYQKSGLMHDLLTGERPVKLDDPEPADV